MKSTFSEILSKLRRDRGYSQRRAAADLGISQALLSHYENGAREPKLDFVVKACDYYFVSADYLLGRTSERRSKGSQLARALNNIVGTLEEHNQTEAQLIEKLKQVIMSEGKSSHHRAEEKAKEEKPKEEKPKEEKAKEEKAKEEKAKEEKAKEEKSKEEKPKQEKAKEKKAKEEKI